MARIIVVVVFLFCIFLSRACAQAYEGQKIPPAKDGENIARGNSRPLDSESQGHYQEGLRYWDAKEFNLAIGEFKKVLLKFPLYYEAYICIGISYLHLGDFHQAISNLNKALEIEPKDTRALTNLGNAYRSLKEYQQAITYYQKSIELDPEYNDVAYGCLGSLYSEMGLYQEARQWYLKAIALYKKNGDNKSAQTVERYLKNLPGN